MREVPDAQWTIHADGTVQVSQVWLDIIGRSAIEAPGYRWSESVHPDDQHLVRVIEDCLVARCGWIVTLRVRHHHGDYVVLRCVGAPRPRGGFTGWTTVCQDGRRLAPAPVPRVRRSV